MTSRELQGWYSDPFGRHEARYFSAAQPTKLVRDGDAESYDEPSGEELAGPGAWGDLAGWTPRRAEGGGGVGADSPDHEVPAFRRRGPQAGVLAGVAVAVVAGLAAAALLVGRPGTASRPTAAAADAIEAMAYTATMNANSADVVEITAITAENRKFDTAVTESGAVSWSADQGEATLQTMTGGRSILSGREIFDGTKSYGKYSVAGVSASALARIPGATGWTETTWSGTSSGGSWGFLGAMLLGDTSSAGGLASPATLLALLKAQASSVQNLGSEVLGGVSTTHYRALIPLSRLGDSGQELLQAERTLGADSIGVDYWIDSAHLLRQLRMALSIVRQPTPSPTVPGEKTVFSVAYTSFSITLKLSHYGVPVHIVPPPAKQITSHVACVNDANGFSCG